MNINEWLDKINQIDNNYIKSMDNLIKFIKLIEYKYITLQKIEISDKIYKMLNNKKYIFIWDCEFQVFKCPQSYNSNNISYEQYQGKKMIRAIAEIGIILLLNIKNNIYFSGLFHCGFLNKRFAKIVDYTPFYHEYMSVHSDSEKQIIKLEENIYPHLIFEKIWNDFLFFKDSDKFSNDVLIFIKNNNVLKSEKSIINKFKEQIYDLVSLIEQNQSFDNLEKNISKIINNLKNIIYTKLIKSFKFDNKFKKINNIYLSDKYIKKILLGQELHNNFIKIFNLLISEKDSLNIIKGSEDIKAMINHNIYLNDCYNNVPSNNIIDIAEYNAKIYEICSSAKLYESYICLNKDNSKDNSSIINELKKYILSSTIKPHNPLNDAYYTLQVFILFNLL
jgi:hypothetical protein